MDANSDDINLIRTLIPDVDDIYGDDEDEYLFSDDQIKNFFKVAAGNVIRAAGLAMIAVGNSEAMINKVIRTQDLQTNGAALQREWRESGARLLDLADSETAQAALDYVDIIDYGDGWSKYPPELTEREGGWFGY